MERPLGHTDETLGICHDYKGQHQTGIYLFY